MEFRNRRFDFDWPGTDRREILIDPGKIGQVLENLLSNAVKFSPEGSLIRVSGSMDDYVATLVVRDEGVGMNPEQVGRVFDKFYRADCSHTAVPGLGLGMGIAKGIVEAHGGHIQVKSSKGAGTAVTFTLPINVQA
jgi:signal transduction histidine kinase